MRLLFIAGVLFLFNFGFAQISPIKTVEKMSFMSEELQSYSRELMKKNKKPSDEILRSKLLLMYDGVFAGSLLRDMKKSLDAGFTKGWVLACTDNFDWALLPFFPKDLCLTMSNDSQAVVECCNQILNTYILGPNLAFDMDGQTRQFNTGSFKETIRGIYERFEISNPPLSQYLAEVDSLSDEAVYQLKAREKFVFYLKKVENQWKIERINHKFENSQLVLEG